MTAKEILKKHKFTQLAPVKDRRSVSFLFKKKENCGIYVLKFTKNEYYVGQSVNIPQRYIQHAQKHDDIEEISYKLIHKDELDKNERQLITEFESADLALRNIVFASIPIGTRDFDLLMSKQDQRKWLADHNAEPTIHNRSNIISDLIERKYVKKYKELISDKQFEQPLRVLKKYFTYCIPEPILTELDFWRISCLYESYKDITIYNRINIYKQEVSTIGNWHKDKTSLYTFHLTKSIIQNNKKKLDDLKLKSLQIFDHIYKSGGTDQVHFELSDFNDVLLMLDNTIIRKAIKTFNLRLMRKGPGLNKPSHCALLAENILSEHIK